MVHSSPLEENKIFQISIIICRKKGAQHVLNNNSIEILSLMNTILLFDFFKRKTNRLNSPFDVFFFVNLGYRLNLIKKYDLIRKKIKNFSFQINELIFLKNCIEINIIADIVFANIEIGLMFKLSS